MWVTKNLRTHAAQIFNTALLPGVSQEILPGKAISVGSSYKEVVVVTRYEVVSASVGIILTRSNDDNDWENWSRQSCNYA